MDMGKQSAWDVTLALAVLALTFAAGISADAAYQGATVSLAVADGTASQAAMDAATAAMARLGFEVAPLSWSLKH